MRESMLRELVDREQIKELKARYFRCFDTKDWVGWRAVFTDDATLTVGGLEPTAGADALVARSSRVAAPARTAHIAGLAEIAFDGPDEARAIWVLRDYLEWPVDPVTGRRRGMHGYGHEWDTVRRVDGEWRIAAVRVAYLRKDALSDLRMPELEILGGVWGRT